MKHWRHTNPSKPPIRHEHRLGIELALEELLECKRYADNLELPAQQRVKTHLLGGFISHFKGRGMDFDEARLYQMGDDIRSIDWRVTARTGEAHTKIYREERERPVFVLLDQSPGMMFGSRQQFKAVQAAKLASTIMWKSLADGNRFGALIFDETEHYEYKPATTRKNCLRVLNKIVENHNLQISQLYLSKEYQADERNSLKNTLQRTRKLARPGSLIFIISDFQQFDDECENHLLRLSQHNEISLLQITDPLEKDLPPSGQYTITNGKQRVAFNTQSRSFRQRFHKQFERRADYLNDLSLKHRLRWHMISTEQSLGQLMAMNQSTQKRGGQ